MGALNLSVKPVRDEQHLAFLRTLPCAVPRCRARYVRACHIGPHGISQKASDHDAAPLCDAHHDELDGRVSRCGRSRSSDSKSALRAAFDRKYGIDILAIARLYSAKPIIRVSAGGYVSDWDGYELRLAPVNQTTLLNALKRVRELRREIAHMQRAEELRRAS